LFKPDPGVKEIIMVSPPSGPLLSVRSAVVLLVALVVGLLASFLGFFATGGLANAMLIGGAAAGGALALSDRLLGRL
jgi:hypothetical protein